MASLRFLLQGLSETNDHLAAIRELFNIDNINQCLVSVAFMNAGGARLLLPQLESVRKNIQLFVGIRNGITSVQAFRILHEAGIFPICVDTATQSYIFHPKVYLASNDATAKLIVGSANITSGGLVRNVETSLVTELNKNEDADLLLYQSIIDNFLDLKRLYPNNVFETSENTDIEQMVEDGFLFDEATALPQANGRGNNNRVAERNRMMLHTRAIQVYRHPRSAFQAPRMVGAAEIPVVTRTLLWKSSPLSRRDLNIPTGAQTNATGSMLLKLGDASQNINFQHYFRDEVFATANWQRDIAPRTAHYERTIIKFRIIIKGIDYGVHELKVSHNTNTQSRTYEQRNAMTQIHWGEEVRPMIAQEDLLDGIMCIFAPVDGSDIYILDIDSD